MFENSKWIGYPENTETHVSILKKSFKVTKDVKTATLTSTALGCYHAEINSKQVSDFVLAPGWTSFQRVQAQKYNIKNLLSSDNTITVSISRGWRYGRIRTNYSKHIEEVLEPSFICEIDITYTDGTKDKIVTDTTWQSSKSKTTFADIYDGEIYDSTYEEKFVSAAEKSVPDVKIVKQQGEKITEHETFKPLSVFKTPNGETVCDFGQNLTGYPEIKVNAKKGDKVSLSFAEVLDKDGNFYNANYRSAKCNYEYICHDGFNTYKPTHTFYGFRYVRVNSFPKEIEKDDICAIAVYSDMKRTGYLSSSNPMLNKLFSNIVWGNRDNYLDIPTDCPQRDERLGWTGDAQMFVRAATYNFDVERFFEKWLEDIKLDQGTNGAIPHVVPAVFEVGEGQQLTSSSAWAEACTVCPWQVYTMYNSKAILKNMYPVMCKYLTYIKNISEKKYLWYTEHGHYGDWLALDAEVGSWSGISNIQFISSAFYLYSTSIVIKTGKVLGKNVEKYEKLYANILKTIRKTFKEYKTQTEHVLALYFDIAEDKASVAASLAKMIEENGNRLKTGFVGTPYLLWVLSQNGYEDLAYTLLLQDKFPSWLYSVKCGATTIWEHWDSRNEKGEFWSTDMNSFNHYAYGSVADWVYGYALGITPEEPGFEKIRIAPHATDKIDSLSAVYESRKGKIVSKWYHEDGKVRYEIETPADTVIVIDGKEYEVTKGSYIF